MAWAFGIKHIDPPEKFVLVVMAVAKLLIDECPLIVLPSLVTAIGLHEACILQAIHNQSKKSQGGSARITHENLSTLLPFLSITTIRRHISSLLEANLMDRKFLSENKKDRTSYYFLNYEKISELKGGIYES